MIKTMIYNSEHYAVMANDIVKGKHIATLQQTRFIRLMVAQIVKQDEKLRKYTCRIQDFAEFFDIPPNNLYTDIDKLCNDLLNCKVHIGTGNPKRPWMKINWFNSAEYDGNGEITLCLSEQIKPYVTKLSDWYTQYQLHNIVSMKSFYGVRLYEILKCDDTKARDSRNVFTYSINSLKEMLNCENKYKQIKELKEFVIEKAVQEINNNTDLLVYTEYIKTGGKITDIKFELFYNRHNLTKPSKGQPQIYL